tara:strand:- start:290 stop:490 length:201 start_codon:yes stop_codon:yes gene_type:complete
LELEEQVLLHPHQFQQEEQIQFLVQLHLLVEEPVEIHTLVLQHLEEGLRILAVLAVDLVMELVDSV